jgi:hypothetical protein
MPAAHEARDARSIRAVDVVVLFLTLLPALAWLEQALRPAATPLILRDCVLQACALLCFLAPLTVARYFYLPLFLIAGYGLHAWFRRGVRDWADPRLRPAKRLLFWGVVWVIAADLYAFWCWTGAWRPMPAAIAGLLFAVVYAILLVRRVARRRWLGLAPGLVGLLLIVVFTTQQSAPAQELSGERLFNLAAYDAGVLPDESVVALAAHARRAFIRPPGQKWTEVAHTYAPQRFAVDSERRDVYFANFGARWKRAVTKVHGLEAFEIDLPRCSKPIDIVFDADPIHRRIYVACEFSGTVHFYNVNENRLEMLWEVPRAPYAMALDSERRALYVSSEFYLGRITKLDVLHEHVVASRTLGMVLWGVAADERTGNVFVARPLAGDVVVLDQNLRVLACIPVGDAPRDLVFDKLRRIVWVGQYFSGVVTGISADNRQVIARYRVADSGRLHRLRGVGVAPDGRLLLSDSSGVWRISPLTH